jgi:hypothetical protein
VFVVQAAMERRSIFLEGVFGKLGAVGRRGSFKTWIE